MAAVKPLNRRLNRDVLYLIASYLDSAQDLSSFFQISKDFYQASSYMLARVPVQIRSCSSLISFGTFLSRMPESTNCFRELNLTIPRMHQATAMRSFISGVVINILTISHLVSLEIGNAFVWETILPAEFPLPSSLEQLVLRNFDIPSFHLAVVSSAQTNLSVLHAYFFDRVIHEQVAICLSPLHQSTTLRELKLVGRFDDFTPEPDTVFPAVNTLCLGITHRPSMMALTRAFPALRYLQFVPRLWHRPRAIIPLDEYTEINAIAPSEETWNNLDTLWGTSRSVSITAIKSTVTHLILEAADLPSIAEARFFVDKYSVSKLTFVFSAHFLLVLAAGRSQVEEAFGTLDPDFLRGIAFSLEDPYIIFSDKVATEEVMPIVWLSQVPYFEVVYTREQRSQSAASPDNASDRLLEDVVRRMATLCISLQLVGLDSLDRGMTFWEIIRRDAQHFVVRLMSARDGIARRNMLLRRQTVQVANLR